MQLTGPSDFFTIALVTPNNDHMVDGLIFKFCEGKNLNRKDDIMHFKDFKYAMETNKDFLVLWRPISLQLSFSVISAKERSIQKYNLLVHFIVQYLKETIFSSI